MDTLALTSVHWLFVRSKRTRTTHLVLGHPKQNVKRQGKANKYHREHYDTFSYCCKHMQKHDHEDPDMTKPEKNETRISTSICFMLVMISNRLRIFSQLCLLLPDGDNSEPIFVLVLVFRKLQMLFNAAMLADRKYHQISRKNGGQES